MFGFSGTDEERALHGQLDARRGSSMLREGARSGGSPRTASAPARCRADELHDAAVLEQRLVVEVSAAAGCDSRATVRCATRQPPASRSGRGAAARPAPGTATGRERQHACSSRRAQLLLALGRHQEVPEGAELLALVRVVDGVALAEDLGQQRALACSQVAILSRTAAVEPSEILLDLAEVGQQAPGGGGHLLEPIPDPGGVHYLEFPALHLCDLVLELLTAALELGDARRRIERGALDDLPKQVENRHDPRLGRHEGAAPKGGEPLDRPLRAGRDVEMRLVRVRRVVLAQPAVPLVRPLVEVLVRAAREGVRALDLAQAKEGVLQLRSHGRLRERANVRRDEDFVEKAGDERRVAREEEPPGRMAAAQRHEIVVIHGGLSSGPAPRPPSAATSPRTTIPARAPLRAAPR